MDDLIGLIKENQISGHLRGLFEEYSSHASPEANYVKSLDLFDMFLQAYEYEQLNHIELNEFFSHVSNYTFEPQIKGWIDELMEIRGKRLIFFRKIQI